MLVTDKVINRSSSRVNWNNPYNGTSHTGVDLYKSSNEEENKIYSHSAGKVTVAIDGKDKMLGSEGIDSYGNYVEIDHGNGYKTRYAHMLKNSVKVRSGQTINANTQIGIMGETGNADGRHLHFEVLLNGARQNPVPFLTKELNGTTPPTPTGDTYQSHDSRYGWNPNVKINTSEYAGNFGYNLDAIYLDRYQLRVHDMVKGQWLPWVVNRNDYAGNIGNAIDGVQIGTGSSSYSVMYRVHINGGGWLDWVTGCGDGSDGYAGIYGRAIDAIQVGPEVFHV